MSLDDKAAIVLKNISHGKAVYIFDTIEKVIGESAYEAQFLVIRYMQQKGLIEEYGLNSNGLVQIITPSGHQILQEFGGWLEYLKANENENAELARVKSENADFQRKIQLTNTKIQRGLLVVGIATLFFLGYGAYQTDKNNTLEKKLKEEQQKSDSLFKVTIFQEGRLKEKISQKPDSLSN